MWDSAHYIDERAPSKLDTQPARHRRSAERLRFVKRHRRSSPPSFRPTSFFPRDLSLDLRPASLGRSTNPSFKFSHPPSLELHHQY